ncbi:MAG: S8 family serine peptidase, partial [Bacteroidota bacterium]
MKLLLHTKSRSCQFLLAVLVCLLGGNLAVAQVEVNVKLNPGETAWQGFLQNPLPDAPLVQRYAVLRQLEQTRRAQEAGTFKQADPDLSRIFTLQFVGENTSAILSSLRNTGVFEFVEENFTRKVHALTGTPPNDDSVAAQWHHPYIRTFDAWDMTRGSANVKVGVIDTGLDFNHPEYEGQIAINLPEDHNGNGTFEPWSNTETQNGRTGDFDGIDNDGNGYVDDVVGYDFTDQPRSPFGGDYLEADPDPTDDNSHGTIVSGIIHAKADNGFGGTGVAPACKLVVLRAFAANGSGEDDDIARAIIYAADNDIRILNFSFGDIYPSKIMHEAIKYAYSRGVIMVSSAGNGTGDELHYPSGFNEVISVSATSYDPATGREFLWPLSSYGVTVDLSAPGSGILCPTILDTATNGEVTAFGRYSGTSAAAPMVAGTAALLMSYRGNFTPQQMRGILTTSTDDVSDPGWDHFTGAGRLNMVKALQSVGAAQVQIVTPENDTGSPRDTVYLLGTILDPEFEQYHIEYQEGLEDVNPWLPISVEQRRQLKNDTLGMWDLTGIPEGEYTLRVRVDRTNGFTSEDRIRFIRDKSPPEVDLRLAAPAWDNEQRKLLVIFRDNDQGTHVLNYRPLGSNGPFRTITFDRTTRNGEFLLGSDRVPSGTYELFIRATNLAGLTADSRVDTVVFESKFVNRAGFRRIAPTLPMGRFLPGNFDINKNGLADVVVSEYGDQLEFGRLKFYEFNGIFFQAVDSITISPVLIPKDITDTDGDGLLELLCSVNDSTYILEQETPFVFPKNVIYSNLGNELYSANFSDTDADGQEELVMKDFEDYFVFEGGGANFTQAAILEDISPNYIGSTAPRSITGDFDNDVRPESVFGDFDGDILVYEHG